MAALLLSCMRYVTAGFHWKPIHTQDIRLSPLRGKTGMHPVALAAITTCIKRHIVTSFSHERFNFVHDARVASILLTVYRYFVDKGTHPLGEETRAFFSPLTSPVAVCLQQRANTDLPSVHKLAVEHVAKRSSFRDYTLKLLILAESIS